MSDRVSRPRTQVFGARQNARVAQEIGRSAQSITKGASLLLHQAQVPEFGILECHAGEMSGEGCSSLRHYNRTHTYSKTPPSTMMAPRVRVSLRKISINAPIVPWDER